MRNITKSWTITDLREEAECRGINLGSIKLSKADLLKTLGEGSASVLAAKAADGDSKPTKVSAKPAKAASKPSETKTAPKSKSKSSGDKVAKAAPKATKACARLDVSDGDSKPMAKTTKPASKSDAKPAPQKRKPITNEEPSQKKAKSTPTLAKPPATKKLATTAEPPRISKKMTLEDLKIEVKARQIVQGAFLPKTKAELLHFLVDGTIRVSETDEYKKYLSLLERVEQEKDGLRAQSLAKLEAESQKKEAKRKEKQEKEDAARLAGEKARKEAQRVRREIEMAQQKVKHKHSFSRVHVHPLAKTSELKISGTERNPTCDVCDNHGYFCQPGFTCEACDWDICLRCFQLKNMDPQARQQLEKKQRLEREKRIREQERRDREEEARRAEEEAEWDAESQFKKGVIQLSASSKKFNNSDGKYVVWCSDGYDNDGWHSYEGAPRKEYDSSWKTKEEANNRARYLFFWKNPWGIDPEEVSDDNGVPEPSMNDGFVSYSVAPADSSRWTVGVVPSSAFKFLDQATEERHSYDGDASDDRIEGEVLGFFY